jgi:hypothetical protein
MDLNKKADRSHLMDMVEHSRKKLDDVRASRRALLDRAKGSEWFPSEERVPINQIAQQEAALLQHLAGGDPRALVVPGGDAAVYAAYEQTLAVNKTAQRLNMRRKFRRLVQDALYGIGICRLAMAPDGPAPLKEVFPEMDEEAEYDSGRLEMDVISLESWVHDCQADTIEEVEFCGHAYWVAKEDIKKHLPGVSQADLITDEKRWIDEQGHEMAGAISRGVDGEGQYEYRNKCWLWDLWLPKQGVLITTPVNGTGELANVRQWRSRPGGPYLFLYYRELPDQAIPISILADLALLHDSLNSTFRKLIDQAREAKTVLGFKPGHEDDAGRVRDARSRDIIQMRDPTAVQEFNYNGPDQSLLAIGLQTRELASIMGGNTDVLAGLGAQAPTATQEQMVSAQAGGKIRLHEQDTADFQMELFEAIRWYLYHHEQIRPIPITKEIGKYRVPSVFHATKAQAAPGNYDSYQMQIEPYTDIYRSPEERFQTLVSLWERLIMPGVQLGVIDATPDMMKLLEIAAQYLDLPEVKQLLRVVRPEEREMTGDARQSPTTTRNYVRRSAPGPTRSGNAMTALQMMGNGNGSATTQ